MLAIFPLLYPVSDSEKLNHYGSGSEILILMMGYFYKGFMDEKKMFDHENWHKGIKPYKCCWCEKSYQNFANLSAHQRALHLDLYRLRHKEKVRIQFSKRSVQVSKRSIQVR